MLPFPAPVRAFLGILRAWDAAKRVQFFVLWIGFFLSGIGSGLTLPLLSVYVVEKGFSLQEYGVMQSVASLGLILTQVFIGRVSDVLGKRKPLVLASLLLSVPAFLMFPRADTALVLGILLTVNQVTLFSFRFLMPAWVNRWLPPEGLGRFHGLFRGALSLGWVLAAPFLGLLLDGYGAAFTTGAIVALMTAVLIHFFAREGMPTAGRETKVLDSSQAGGRAFNTAALNMVLFAVGVFTLARFMGMNFNFIYMMNDLGVSNTQFGWLTSMQAWLEMPLMLIFGAVSDRVDMSAILGFGMALSGMRWFLLSMAGDTLWVYPIQLMNAIGVTVTESLLVAYIARLVPEGRLATFLGWSVTIRSAAMLLAPLIGGVLAQQWGIRTVFHVSFVLALAASGIVVAANRGKGQIPASTTSR